MKVQPGHMQSLVLAGLLAWPALAIADQPTPETIRDAVGAQTEPAIKLFREFLAIPNDANNPDEIAALLEWCETTFASYGFETSRLETAGSASLIATRLNPAADKTLLVYLQADGQPVDDDAWDQASPYLPVLKEQNLDGDWVEIPWVRLEQGIDPDWRVFARSAADSKGPMTQFLMAMKVLDDLGVVPAFNIKVLIDTEEELGSPNLPAAIQAQQTQLAADMLLIFDGPPHASNRPTVSFGARGIATVTLTAYGPLVPQHSGHYGNFVPNPANQLVQLLSSMKDADGRVTIDGFYDGIEIDEATRALLEQVPDDEDTILGSMGLIEAESVAESLQLALQYPSLNIRGLASAWTGTESRTIIPATAVAELDIRLVKETDPQQLLTRIRQHIEAQGYAVLQQAPSIAERRQYPRIVSFEADVSYGAFRSPMDSIPGMMARNAIRHLTGEDAILIRTMGGSIPIAPIIDVLDIPAATVPTVNIDNNQHSPNENLRIGHFIEGIGILAAVLSQQPEGQAANAELSAESTD